MPPRPSSEKPPRALAALSIVPVCIACLGISCSRQAEPAARAEGPPALFEEVAVQAGINVIHDSGARGEYFMPEQAGSGVGVFDYNNDGRMDIYVIHCGGPESKSRNQLFRQEANFTFRDVSAASGLDVSGFGMGVATGDVNNDGWTDLALTEYGRTRLFINDGGTFREEETDSSGIDNPRWGTALGFLDFDRDGWLDLAVGNYLDYNPTQKCFDGAGAREFCGPHSFPGTVARLFRNRGAVEPGEPRFEDVTVQSGFTRASGPALGILCADFDGDRWPDVLLADDGQANRLFINKKNGTFQEEAALRGVAFTGMGSVAANMGVAVGDVNGDALFDFFVTHLASEQHTLWVQSPRGIFSDETAANGLTTPRWKGTGFGALLADLDHDGWPDLGFVNGAVRRGEASDGPLLERLDSFWAPYAQRNQLFLNTGEGRFVDASSANPVFCGRAGMGRGLAEGDLDNDGDVDFVVSNAGGPIQIFRNIAPKSGNSVSFRLVDPSLGGRDALGAEIVVAAGGRHHWGLVQTSFSYLSASDPRVHLGLGSASNYYSVRVIWPDGWEETFPAGAANREVLLARGRGQKQ